MNKYTGPIVGILTARNSRGAVKGNGSLFRELQKKLISLDGISFVFTVEGVQDDSISGYIYLPETQRWIKKNFPFPDIVYNRIPFRKKEQGTDTGQFFSSLQERKIPYFNPCFIDKLTLFRLLENHEELKEYLPETIEVVNKDQLWNFLKQKQSIYLKPAKAAKGKGIYRLKFNHNSELSLEGIQGNKTYSTFEYYWEKWANRLMEKNYLAQEEVESAKYNGKRFDFRILAHGNKGEYELTGIGIRQSQQQEITTHIPAGGSLLPYSLFQTEVHDQFIHNIIPMIGKLLSEKLGFFGEFSIDAAVDQSGQYFIYEVNSKPMSFDEEEIEKARINKLCQLFLQLTNKREK